MAKETLNSLKLQLEQITKERDANMQAAQNALIVANEFGARLENIEKSLQLPFLEKGLFKKIWWVITHINDIAALIEDVIRQIREWREYVEKLRAASKQN
jgi:hypothetical protein